MSEPRPTSDIDSGKRTRRRQRAKRGFVATYIHELSVRHNGGDPRERDRAQRLVERTEGA